MDIYRYELEDNKIGLEIFYDVSKDHYEYYDADLPSDVDTICYIEAVDSNIPITINYPSTSIYAQFYSAPQYLSDVKQRFIDTVLKDMDKEKERFYNITKALTEKLIKIQEIEI